MAVETAAVVEALETRGFVLRGRSDEGWLKLEGLLATADSSLPCELLLDPTFQALPRIRILTLPAGASRINPHIGSRGDLCYIAKGTVVLDIFDPVGQTLACLQKAGEVLTAVLRGELVSDLEDEFFAYWSGPPCLVDMPARQLGRQSTLLVRLGDDLVPVVTDDETPTRKKLDAMGWKVDPEHSVLTYRVRTRAKPRPLVTGAWPPANVGQLLTWQGLLDSRCRKAIEKRLLDAFGRNIKGAVVLIESPLLTYGAAVFFDRAERRRHQAASPRVRLRNCRVAPLSVTRIDDRYISQRNMPGLTTLAGKRLVIVGCGTIGGFLAETLVKAGAGFEGGELVLVDPDTLSPANLGRHRLGFPALFKNKAQALSEELLRGAPTAALRSLPVDVRAANLGHFDLLIDATGEEALGHWLSAEHGAKAPMLTVWIEGPGTAVRGLLRVSGDGACYRCLWEANRRGALTAVKEELPTSMAGQGCEGLYVPFPATASIQAATLGAEMALGWANGSVSPALRCRVLNSRFTPASPDSDPLREPGCPACGT